METLPDLLPPSSSVTPTKARSDYFCHIHGDLDDSLLTPEGFRIYCHIARRGDCWAEVETIARMCGIGVKIVREEIQHLEGLQMILVERRPGRTNLLRIAPRSAWRFNPDPLPNRVGVKKERGIKQTGHPSPPESGHPSPQRPDEVYPISKSQEVSPKKADLLSKAEEIYAAYPRKVGKPAALKAIAKALKETDADLLELTRAFAKAVEHDNPDYIPHPATWFNQARFNDDPATWSKGDRVNKTSGLKPFFPARVETVLKPL
jgi:hypothetical protein